MKKTLFVIITLSLLIVLTASLNMPVGATQDADSGICGEGVTWQIYPETGELVISGSGKMDDYSVLSSNTPPWKHKSVSKVTVESGVTNIGSYAFYDMNRLTSVSLHNGVVSIGEKAFGSCPNLESIYIPASLKNIGMDAFVSCNSLQSVHITDIASWCEIDFFNQYANPLAENRKLYLNGEHVTSLVIPDGVTHIGNYAFCWYDDLTSISIPSGVTCIGKYAFKSCVEVTEITFPEDITHIDDYAFALCSGLTAIELPKSLTVIGASAFEGCQLLEKVVFNEGLTSIGKSAFERCYLLQSIALPRSVRTIEERAFCACSSVKELHIESRLNYVGEEAFVGCGALESVYIKDLDAWCRIQFETYGSSPLFYADHLYLNGELVTEIVIPDGISKIYPAAFSIADLKRIVIPNSVNSIGKFAFLDCTSLKRIDIPDRVWTIDENAFNGCIALESITIPSSARTIGDLAFCGCESLSIVVIPEGVNTIGTSVFSECEALHTVIIKADLSVIPWRAFYGCTSLKTVYLPRGVSKIDIEAFGECKSLSKIFYEGTEEDWTYVERVNDWDCGSGSYEVEYHKHVFSAYTYDTNAPCIKIWKCDACDATSVVVDDENQFTHDYKNGTCMFCGTVKRNNYSMQWLSLLILAVRPVGIAIILIVWSLIRRRKRK